MKFVDVEMEQNQRIEVQILFILCSYSVVGESGDELLVKQTEE